MSTCTVNVPVLCGKPAVQALRVKEFPFSDWQESFRCADHPAGDWVTMVKRAFPMADVRVEWLADHGDPA